jgi:hypothetical protein
MSTMAYAFLGLMGAIALYAMATEAKLPARAATGSAVASRASVDQSQPKATADSAPVVTDTSEVAGADESKQDGGFVPEVLNETVPPPATDSPADDSPAASMSTAPDMQPAPMAGKPAAGNFYEEATMKAAVTGAYGKPVEPPPPVRDDPEPESDQRDETRAEGGDSKASDFIGK